MKDANFQSMYSRLLIGTGARSDADLARVLGIKPQSVFQAKKKGKIPDQWLTKIALEYSLSIEWLLTGQAERMEKSDADHIIASSWRPPVHISVPKEENPWKSAPWQDVPVVGLANCGDSDWFTPDRLALRATLPVDYPYNPENFAVLAVGTSMQPDGIRQGNVVFCDPSVPPDPGDSIYIERVNGTTSLKRYHKYDEDALHVQGWKPPLPDGTQKPYFEIIPRDEIKRISCVVVIKRKG